MEIKDDEGKGKGEEGEEGEEGEGQGEGEGEGEGEGQGEGEGEGQGEGEGEGQGEGEDDDGESESGKPGNGARQPKKGGKTIQQHLKNISESKPYSHQKSLSKYEGTPKFISFSQRIKDDQQKPYRFNSGEIKDAEALIKLLDINFDPKSDEVKNLKLGKLDVSKIAEVPAGNVSVYKQIVEEQDTKPFSVCILADMSGSMGYGNRIQSQRHILNSLYLAMTQILPPDKLYIYGHSGEYTPEIYTFYSPYDTDYERNIKYYQSVNWCQNYDGPVIEAIHKKIRENSEDRIIFISLSDGDPAGNNYGGKEDNEELKRILERARRDSFVTVGIGIEAGHVSSLYTYAKPVWDLSTLPKEVSGIINQVVRSEFK
jgi:cobalamin biosynthesis protein CobT